MGIHLVTLFFLLVEVVFAQDVDVCGNRTYDPSQDVCWDASVVCPIIDGLAERACGGQCYSILDQTCDNGTVDALPLLEGPYELRAFNQYEPFGYEVITACDGGFFIGRSTCTWCPSSLGGLCSTLKNITALSGSQSMDVIVPGGQQFYIDAVGPLAYTRAHSAYIPKKAILGEVRAFRDGGFVYAAGGGWYACPAVESGVWQVVNRLEGVVLDAACLGINIAVRSLDGDGPFAWQYQ